MKLGILILATLLCAGQVLAKEKRQIAAAHKPKVDVLIYGWAGGCSTDAKDAYSVSFSPADDDGSVSVTYGANPVLTDERVSVNTYSRDAKEIILSSNKVKLIVARGAPGTLIPPHGILWVKQDPKRKTIFARCNVEAVDSEP